MTGIYICAAAACVAMLLGSAFPWWGYIIILFVSIINNYISEKTVDYFADALLDAQDPQTISELDDAITKLDKIAEMLDQRTIDRMNTLTSEEFDEFLIWCHEKEHENNE